MKRNIFFKIKLSLLAIGMVFGLSLNANEYKPPKTIQMLVPAGTGGGWDLTLRTVQKTLKDTKLVNSNMPVINKPGGGGAINLAYFQTQDGKDNSLTVYSSPLLLIKLNKTSNFGYEDLTPIASLIADYAAFIVPINSRFNNIKEVVDSLKKDIKSVKIGGVSATGSMDHIVFLMLAKAAGISDLKGIDYISFQDTSPVAQVLGGHVDLIIMGVGDVESLVRGGKLKVLAQSSEKRIGTGDMSKIPTLKEEGIDMVFANWRGIFGPKNMPKNAVKYWEKTLLNMTKTKEWKEALVRNAWDDLYLDSQSFKKFLTKANVEYKQILDTLFAKQR